MDSAQRLLFGEFPRAVGVTTPDFSGGDLTQYMIHSEQEFDGVFAKVEGERNMYSSISAYIPKLDDGFKGCAVLGDKVSFDFDSSAKAVPDAEEDWAHPLIPADASDAEVIDRMRTDRDVREAVLGDVCFNVRKLAEECIDRDIPIFGVFSGFGVHVHTLWEPTMSRPEDKMRSTCNMFVSELELSCVDEKASGRPFRIMRVPNVERICHGTGRGTGLFTAPLKAGDLAVITPDELMSWSESPSPMVGHEPFDRPEMKVREDYLGPGYEEGVGQEKMRSVPEQAVEDELARTIIRETVQMPCVYERAFGRNPPNDVRVKLGIMLLNAGYSVQEATDLIAKLGWADFDRSVTSYQLKKLRESGKGDWSCRTMQAKGLCTRADDKQECPTYGYRGGNVPWKT